MWNGPGARGYEGKQDEIITEWKQHMTVLANECPNVTVKVGAGAFPSMGHGFETREKPPSSEEVAGLFGPLYLWVIETFTPRRCMFEGNFPVDKVSIPPRHNVSPLANESV